MLRGSRGRVERVFLCSGGVASVCEPDCDGFVLRLSESSIKSFRAQFVVRFFSIFCIHGILFTWRRSCGTAYIDSIAERIEQYFNTPGCRS
jgi:hypothetical protein